MPRAKTRQKPQKKQVRGRRRAVLPALLLAFLLALGGAFGWMAASARITALKQAQLFLPDLPAAFDGTSILYISDIDIRNDNDSAATIKLMRKLQDLEPDMLILGGDYSAATLLEGLNGASGGDTAKAQDFIASLAGFSAPLGKFAVAGENDDPAALASLFAASGVQLLSDACAAVQKGASQLVIAGLSDSGRNQTPYEQIGGYFSGDECVIAVAHNPSSYVGIRVAEARGGGAWADAVLSGHTLGGQIQIFGRTLRNLPEAEKRCIGGWYYSDDLPMLVSQGLGCKGAMLRLGSDSEVWLITLRCPQENAGVYLPN